MSNNSAIVDIDLQFFRPTRTMRELFLMLSLDNTRRMSQHELARKVSVSSSMANNYMKALKRRGLIAVHGNTNRCMKYALTPKGRANMARFMSMYSMEIARFYSIAKREVEKRLHELREQRFERIVLFGAAETGELVYSAAKAVELQIIGWVDNDRTKHGMRFGEIPVTSPALIESYRPDAVLIASSGKTEEIRFQLRELPKKGIAVVTL
jgi:DNA-binding MarR family transcriptional regulator